MIFTNTMERESTACAAISNRHLCPSALSSRADRLRQPNFCDSYPSKLGGSCVRTHFAIIARVFLMCGAVFKPITRQNPSHDHFPFQHKRDGITLPRARNHVTAPLGLCHHSSFWTTDKCSLVLFLIPKAIVQHYAPGCMGSLDIGLVHAGLFGRTRRRVQYDRFVGRIGRVELCKRRSCDGSRVHWAS